MHIMIDEPLLKVLCTVPPVLLQVKSEIAGYDLPASVRHETRMIHLSHESIDQGHTSGSSLPALDDVLVDPPFWYIFVQGTIFIEHAIPMSVAVPVAEVPPVKLSDEVLRALILSVPLFILLGLPINELGRDSSACHPWGEFRRIVGTHYAVPCLFIGTHVFSIP